VINPGPFDSERDARAAALAAVPPDEGRTVLSGAQNRQLLGQACEAAGIEMGRYDDRIVEWLSGWEDAICMVVAGLVTRAYAAGMAAREDGGHG
jgi:hypothetical protein